MAEGTETFFTTVGCMDGRVQEPISKFGQEKFGAKYPDTITEAGLVGILVNNPSQEFLSNLKKKLDISIRIHHSRGVVVHGHQDCAGNPVDDESHKEDVWKSVRAIQNLINSSIPVIGVFVRQRENEDWRVEEL